MKHVATIKTALLAVALTAGMAATVLAGNEHRQRTESMEPEDFTTRIDNPFFPLVPGTTFIYAGTKDGAAVRDEYKVTRRTKMVMGVKCRVILDRFYVEDVLEEETLDWFAQDEDGNVWYFGEAAKELDETGNVISTEGSWEAGVDGALPGIAMEAHPRVGDTYRQEYAAGVAEDMGTVLALHQKVKLADRTFKNCLKTKDFSNLDSAVEHKYYAPGIGFILSDMISGEVEEHIELVDIIKD
jgi:hypothetical protein